MNFLGIRFDNTIDYYLLFLYHKGNWERGVSYVHLETLKSLDRESTASYLLNISATATSRSQANDVFRGKLYLMKSNIVRMS